MYELFKQQLESARGEAEIVYSKNESITVKYCQNAIQRRETDVPIYRPIDLTKPGGNPLDLTYSRGATIACSSSIQQQSLHIGPPDLFDATKHHKLSPVARYDPGYCHVEVVDDSGADARDEFDLPYPLDQLFTQSGTMLFNLILKANATQGRKITIMIHNRFDGSNITKEKTFTIT